MNRYNSEGYPDPTAAEALTNIRREEIARMRKPFVFICSPYAGDIARNTENARRYMRFAVEQGAIPFAPHLLYPQVLDEDDTKQRELGLFFGMVWLGKCDELWVFGDSISTGMKQEIAKAKQRRMPIRYFNENGAPAKPPGFVGRGGTTEQREFSPQGGNEQVESVTTRGRFCNEDSRRQQPDG